MTQAEQADLKMKIGTAVQCIERQRQSNAMEGDSNIVNALEALVAIVNYVVETSDVQH